MKNKSSAFSLIELSIVILVIGILIAGVTQGSRVVAVAKLKTAQTLTKSAPVSSVEGLVLWLEPTLEDSFIKLEMEDGTHITKWKDINPQSSLKYFAVHTDDDAVLGPVYKLNSGPNNLPSLLFDENLLTLASDAAGDFKTAIFTEDNAFTYFLVSARSSEFSSDNYAISNNAYHFWGYEVFDGVRSLGPEKGMTFPFPCLTPAEIISATFSGSADVESALNTYLNGVGSSSNGSNSMVISYNSQEKFYIGAYDESPTAPWLGYISEIIVFDHALTNEERQSIERYLGKKYGIKIVQDAA